MVLTLCYDLAVQLHRSRTRMLLVQIWRLSFPVTPGDGWRRLTISLLGPNGTLGPGRSSGRGPRQVIKLPVRGKCEAARARTAGTVQPNPQVGEKLGKICHS